MANGICITTNSEEETMAVAQQFGKTMPKGTVITLNGDLGAGKTHFVKGFVQGADCSETVTSPTFTILNLYEGGRLPIYHFDMYRLHSVEEAQELGFEEYFDGKTDGIVLVEWPTQVEGLIQCARLEIDIRKTEQENQRKIYIRSQQ